MDNPETLADSTSIGNGNAILGHVLGSKDESRRIAPNVAKATAIDSGIIKKLLPLLATAVMGALT